MKEKSKSFLYRSEKNNFELVTKENCKLCKGPIEQTYIPMEQWNIDGPLCGKCYSKKIADHYPGDHVKVGSEKTE